MHGPCPPYSGSPTPMFLSSHSKLLTVPPPHRTSVPSRVRNSKFAPLRLQLRVRVEGEGGCMAPALPTLAPHSHVPLLPLQAAHCTTTSPHFSVPSPVRFAIRNSKFAPLRLQWRVRVEGSSQTHSVPSTHSARTAPSLPQKRANKPRACAAFPKRSPISDARVRVSVEFRLELVGASPEIRVTGSISIMRV